jgi:hypothetical protein
MNARAAPTDHTTIREEILIFIWLGNGFDMSGEDPIVDR